MSGNVRQLQNMKDLVCLAEEVEFYLIGNKKPLKNFQHQNDEIMLDYIENIMQVIDTGDDKSLLHFK